ncbi:unnamed protein product [Chrysoparadoxa australica]
MCLHHAVPPFALQAISDSSLLWIAERALKEPLPEGWVRQRTQDGRKYYYNRVTQTSRWDHPLDPHYRALYYKHRFGGLVQEQGQALPCGNWRLQGRRAPKDPAAAQPCLLPRQRRPQLSKFTQVRWHAMNEASRPAPKAIAEYCL